MSSSAAHGPGFTPRTIGRRNVHLSLVVPGLLLLGLVVVAQTATPERASSTAVVAPPASPRPPEPPAPTAEQVAAARTAVDELAAWAAEHGAADPAGLYRRAAGAAATAAGLPDLQARARAFERQALTTLESDRDRTLRVGLALEQGGLFFPAQKVYRAYLARIGEGAPTATSPAFEALKRTGRAQAFVARDRAALETALRAGDTARADALAAWIGVYAGPDAERVVRSAYPALRPQ